MEQLGGEIRKPANDEITRKRQEVFQELESRCETCCVENHGDKVCSVLGFAEEFLKAFKEGERHGQKVNEVSKKFKDCLEKRWSIEDRRAMVSGWRDAYCASTSPEERKELVVTIKKICGILDK